MSIFNLRKFTQKYIAINTCYQHREHPVMQAGGVNGDFGVVSRMPAAPTSGFRLEKNVLDGTYAALQKSALHFMRSRARDARPLMFSLPADLARHVGGRGPRTGRVGEHMHGGEGAAAYEIHGLSELFLRFAGEAYDEVGGQPAAGEAVPQDRYGLHKTRRIVSPAHAAEGGVAAALEREMEMAAHILKRDESVGEIIRYRSRLK